MSDESELCHAAKKKNSAVDESEEGEGYKAHPTTITIALVRRHASNTFYQIFFFLRTFRSVVVTVQAFILIIPSLQQSSHGEISLTRFSKRYR